MLCYLLNNNNSDNLIISINPPLFSCHANVGNINSEVQTHLYNLSHTPGSAIMVEFTDRSEYSDLNQLSVWHVPNYRYRVVME